MKTDVLVIGAGASGLACARELTGAGVGVVVLEARDRIGGRIRTFRPVGEEPVELGAHVVHGARAATLKVLGEAGIEATPIEPGGVVVAAEGQSYDVRELLTKGVMPPWALEEVLARADAPDVGVGEVLAALGLQGHELALARDWLVQVWGGEADELSAAGVGRAKRASRAGEGEFVVADGYDRVTEHLARGLDIRLAGAVRRIEWRAGRVEVELDGKRPLHAEVAVVTVPPPVVAADALRFDPPLPRGKRAAAKAIRLADTLVVVVRVAEPVAHATWGLVTGKEAGFWHTRANSRVVVGVLKGGSARRLRGRRIDSELVYRLAGLLFPWLGRVAIEEILAVDWGADPFALGAYSYPRVAALAAPRAWAEPVERSLFFAGEATCWQGHAGMVHGALESGVRCAGEVLATLGAIAGEHPARDVVSPRKGPGPIAVGGSGSTDGKRGNAWS